MVGWLGLVLYAVYADCDPLTAKTVRKQVEKKAKNQKLNILIITPSSQQKQSENRSINKNLF